MDHTGKKNKNPMVIYLVFSWISPKIQDWLNVDLILLLFIESYFILQCNFFFFGKIEKKHGGPWTTLEKKTKIQW